MRRAFIAVALLSSVAVVLGATVFREQAGAGLAPEAEAGETPIQRQLLWRLGSRTRSPETQTFTVPAGKRLRIDLVTFHDLNLRAGLNRFGVRTTVGGVRVLHHLASSKQGVNGDVVTEAVEIYADPGTSVEFTALLRPSPGAVTVIGSFSGALMDAS